MPQFDQLTFFGQLFWFSILFSLFFFIIYHQYIPFLGIFLKSIQKKINFHLHLIFHQILNFFDNLSQLLLEKKKSKDQSLYKNLTQYISWFSSKKNFKMLSFFKNTVNFKRDFLTVKYSKILVE